MFLPSLSLTLTRSELWGSQEEEGGRNRRAWVGDLLPSFGQRVALAVLVI